MASIARVTLINSLIAASDLSKKKAAFLWSRFDLFRLKN
jgi:hypothetical protein